MPDQNGEYSSVMRYSLKKNAPIIYVWASLRLFTSILAVFFSTFRPITDLEKQISIWPPLPEGWNWLNRVFLAPWLRWDALIYVKLTSIGYSTGDGSTSFHPLYILLNKPLNFLGIDPLLSLFITGSLATLAYFWIFYKIAEVDSTPGDGKLALIILASFPVSIVLFMPYTEGVFLLFSALALYLMRKRSWLLAGIAIFLASLTRQQGIFLVFPIIWYVWEDAGKSFQGLLKSWRGLLVAVTSPAGLMTWNFYRIFWLKDGPIELNSWQGFVYSVLISPSAKKLIPDQALMWPWNAAALSLPKLITNPDIADVMNILIGLSFVIYFAIAWKNMEPAHRIYSLVILFVSLSMFTGIRLIYLSLPRHLMLAFPVFIGFAISLKKPRLLLTIASLQLLVQIFMLFLYVTNSWIP
jgi:Gpi18-like mannosyltransferase